MIFRAVAPRGAIWFTVSALLLLALGLLTGCGGSSAPATTGSTAAGSGLEVVMTNRSFDPQEITVKVGDAVTWVNQDTPQHDVVANNGEFKSPLLNKGQSFSFTFTKAGTYPYYCSIHPDMTGKVIVQ
jgi:amicyanin